jgi:hypothetical protein
MVIWGWFIIVLPTLDAMILKRTFQRRSTLGKDENLVEHSSETAQRYFSICFQWDALLF